MSVEEQQKEIVQYLIDKNVLINQKILDKIKELNSQEKIEVVKKKLESHTVITDDLLDSLLTVVPKKTCDINEGNVEILFTYDEEIVKKKEVSDFVNYFKNRFKQIEAILKNRPELQRTLSISRILDKKSRDKVSIIGIVQDIRETRNGNIMLTLEDLSGSIKVLINKNRPGLFDEAKDIVPDEVIGVVGNNGDKIIFANNILWPDIPLSKELKKSPDEAYALFLSDMHVGSIDFLPEKFNKFLKWINGEVGSEEQKAIVSKVKYIFLIGDLVEGVGIYPGQDEELVIKDIYDQYKEGAKLLKKIPKHIKIVICPGNHDAMRISEPQPQISEQLAPDLYEMENVTLVSNPGLVKIHRTDNFPGFDVLLYHGYSFDYYVSNVDSIRNGGGYHRADLLMKFLLKRRHLSPSHSATLYVPDINFDPLVIGIIPDFFATGHIHYTSVSNYNNITMICGSCWQGKTSFQEKTGHDPEPSRIPLINLKTRKPRILKF